MIKSTFKHFTPGQVMLFSFLVVISIGALLLSLPTARYVPVPFLDILFSATSATCVTGLSTVPVDSYTLFGKSVIMGLMQIGGLGLVTLSFFLVSLFVDLGISTRLVAGEILEFQAWGRIKQFLSVIIVVTFLSEAIGTLILYFQFLHIPHEHSPLFLAAFTSVATFCHGGISLFPPDALAQSMTLTALSTMGLLIFAGSIGFIVWYDFARIIGSRVYTLWTGKKKLTRFTLHTKIVLMTTFLLILGGGFAVWLIEQHHTLQGQPDIRGFFIAIFNAMSARGCGLGTLDLTLTSLATLFIFLILMFIGASPGSCGSGIKTSTIAIFSAAVLSIARNRDSVEIAGRRIAVDQIYKSIAIVALGGLWVFLTTFSLLLIEPTFSFIEILFESVSAFGNCGFSLGITSDLSSFGKCILMLTMIIGRIGSLTLVLALQRSTVKHHLYQYPEERIMIG